MVRPSEGGRLALQRAQQGAQARKVQQEETEADGQVIDLHDLVGARTQPLFARGRGYTSSRNLTKPLGMRS